MTLELSRPVRIDAAGVALDGDLVVPERAVGLVLFAHGSGSSRFSRRNRLVAGQLQDRGLATLLLDLLSREEESVDERTAEYRFDIPRLARRLVAAVDHVRSAPETRALPIGLFGASTGAAAALIAAAERPGEVYAVVSRGGRPDLAAAVLDRVEAPALLIVGGDDHPDVLRWNEESARRLGGESRLLILPGATHLFEEPGKLEEAAAAAADWFEGHLSGG